MAQALEWLPPAIIAGLMWTYLFHNWLYNSQIITSQWWTTNYQKKKKKIKRPKTGLINSIEAVVGLSQGARMTAWAAHYGQPPANMQCPRSLAANSLSWCVKCVSTGIRAFQLRYSCRSYGSQQHSQVFVKCTIFLLSSYFYFHVNHFVNGF